MLDPERTMTLVKWLVEEHWMSLAGYVVWNSRAGAESAEPTQNTHKLFKMFPTLEERWHLSAKQYHFIGDILCHTYTDSVWHSFSEDIRDRLSKVDFRQLQSGQYMDHIDLAEDHKFVFIIHSEQAHVLRCFSRHDQERIATWQIHLPKVMSTVRTFVGIHPEVIHPQLQKIYPALTSIGVSHGLGCFMGPMVMQVVASEKAEEHGFDIIYHSPRNSHGKFDSTRPYGVLFDDPSRQP